MSHRHDSKTTSFRFRCTPEELKAWHATAAALGLSLADAIRAGMRVVWISIPTDRRPKEPR